MPLYEYQCKKCKHVFEKIRQFSDPPLKKCPECGGGVEQLLSAPAVQFKGSGWYVTDYARKSDGGSSRSEAKGEESSASKATEKAETKSESKESSKDSKESKPKHESKKRK